MAKILPTLDEYKPDPKLADERGATPERLKRGDVFRDDQSRQHMRDSPINRALTQRDSKGRTMISAAQYTAASKFQVHWYRAALAGTAGSADMSRVFGGFGGGLDRTSAQVFHLERFNAIKTKVEKTLGGHSFWVAEQIICHEQPFTQVGAVFGHKNRTRQAEIARDILLPVLDLMCREWGLA